jgi:hypothetical protein
MLGNGVRVSPGGAPQIAYSFVVEFSAISNLSFVVMPSGLAIALFARRHGSSRSVRAVAILKAMTTILKMKSA